MPQVTIYGKDSCPYTNSARRDFAKRGYEVDYVDVRAKIHKLPEMLELSGGRRAVPVIVENGQVTIGFGGH